MRGLRFFLIVGLACAYFVCLRIMFQGQTSQASQVLSIPSPTFDKVVGNRGLMCVLLLRDGGVEMVDAGHEVDTRHIVPAPESARFTMASMTPSGVGYLLDDKDTLYRVTMAGNRATSKPIEAEGQILAMAVQEKRGLLWLAVRRQSPHPDDLFVLTIDLMQGKILSATNLEKQGTPVLFETTGNGENVIPATDASPSLYVFDYKGRSLFSKAVGLGDLATSVAYSGDFPVIGLRSGGAVMLDPETWRVAGSTDSGQYGVTAVAVSDGAIGVGHGAANERAETGSFQAVGLHSWQVESECSAKAEVAAVASVGRAFLYGLDSGAVGELAPDGGCASLDIPKANRPGPIHFMSSAGNACLIVGDQSVVRLLFR